MYLHGLYSICFDANLKYNSIVENLKIELQNKTMQILSDSRMRYKICIPEHDSIITGYLLGQFYDDIKDIKKTVHKTVERDALSTDWNVMENILKGSAFQSYVVVLNAF